MGLRPVGLGALVLESVGGREVAAVFPLLSPAVGKDYCGDLAFFASVSQ